MLLLPVYLDHLGGTRADIGSVMAAGAFGSLLARPLVGWALDHLGRRRTLIWGTITLTMGMALVGFVDNIGHVAYVQRIVTGIGAGTLFTGYFAFAADIIPISRRTEGIALFGVSGLVPLVINPISEQVNLAPANLRWFLAGIAGIVLLSLIPVMVLTEPPRASPHRDATTPAATFSKLFRSNCLPVWWATAVFSGMVAVFMAFATVAAQRAGMEQPANMWLTYAAGAIMVRLIGARLPDRVGPHNVIAPALGAYAAGALALAHGGSATTYMIAGALGGLGHGYCFPVLTSQVVSRVSVDVRGAGLALFTALWSGSELLLAPRFGRLADSHGDSLMFAGLAIFALIGLSVWVILEHMLANRHNR